MVSVCQWADGEGIVVGYVEEVTPTDARFSLIDPQGQPDKELVLPIVSIYRLEKIPAYIDRLLLFAKLSPPIPDAKGQATASPKVIAKRLREAASTGECVSITLLGDPRNDCRVLRIERDNIEIEEYHDNPLISANVRLVRLNQIARVRWRASGELAVTALWRQQRISSNR